MGYSAGILRDRITILNRKEATASSFGLDADGIEWQNDGQMQAFVDWNKGKSAMQAGALDAYAVKIVRMRYNTTVNARSRIVWNSQVYQIIPETFNPSRWDNTLQFLMQLVVDEDIPSPEPPPTPVPTPEPTEEEETNPQNE